jgi:DNA-binding YbaB/EbfC family protein
VSSDAEGAEGAGFDIGSLLSQLGQVQQNLQEAQQAAAAKEVEGSAGGGAVKVRVSGALEFLDVEIDPSVVDPADVELLEDLVLAAVRDGLERASGLATSALGGTALAGFGGWAGAGGVLGAGSTEDPSREGGEPAAD